MSDTEERGASDGGFDPDKRELCPDGMCIGVIGPDGCCRVCGKRGSAAAASGAAASGAAAEDPEKEWHPRSVPPVGDDDLDAGEDDEGAGDSSRAPAVAGERPDFARERVPCSDGMCTGIVGRDGRCGTCGKAWKADGA